MRILICGDRNWSNRAVIERELRAVLGRRPTIITGGCRGADAIATELARQLGLIVEVYPAEWGLYGRAAGPIRNEKMLNSGVDEVWAFHDDIVNSLGTKDMVHRAQSDDVPVRLFRTD